MAERTSVPPDEALRRLLDGNRRYAEVHATHPDESAARRRSIAVAQHPFAIIFGCADSRVPPEIVFDEGLGDLFVIRVAGHVVDAATIGSVEYAAVELGVQLVLVLGHEGCGAVKAALAAHSAAELPGHIRNLATALGPAITQARKFPGDMLENAVEANVHHAVARLRASKPVLEPLVASRDLAVTGAVYDLHSGLVQVLAEG